jgi:small subunit ribosomal protein S7
MKSGKKAIAERIVYRAFDIVAEKAKDDPVKVWDRALSNVQPKVEVKSRRVGGATYQVPVDVRPGSRHRARHALADLGGA